MLHAAAGTVSVGWDGDLWSERRSQLGSAKCPGQARFTTAFLLLLDLKQGSFSSYCSLGKEECFSASAEWECCLLKAQHCWEAQCREELTYLEETPLPQMPQQEGTASYVALKQPCVLALPLLLCPEPKGVS